MYLFICVEPAETTIEFLSTIDQLEKSVKIPTDKKLTNQLLSTIDQFLNKRHQDWSDLKGLAVFAGPGPFTSLRIVHAIANAVGFSLNCPVVNSDGQSWRQDCWRQLEQNKRQIIVPVYGQPPTITIQKK